MLEHSLQGLAFPYHGAVKILRPVRLAVVNEVFKKLLKS